MKTPQTIMGIALVVLVVLLFTSPRQRAPAYDASDVVTMHGIVQDVQQFYCPISNQQATHLILKTKNGMFHVHVAPTRFLQTNNLSFSSGDEIQVVGSRIVYHGHDAIIARSTTRAGRMVTFREPNGHPLWLK